MRRPARLPPLPDVGVRLLACLSRDPALSDAVFAHLAEDRRLARAPAVGVPRRPESVSFDRRTVRIKASWLAAAIKRAHLLAAVRDEYIVSLLANQSQLQVLVSDQALSAFGSTAFGGAFVPIRSIIGVVGQSLLPVLSAARDTVVELRAVGDRVHVDGVVSADLAADESVSGAWLDIQALLWAPPQVVLDPSEAGEEAAILSWLRRHTSVDAALSPQFTSVWAEGSVLTATDSVTFLVAESRLCACSPPLRVHHRDVPRLAKFLGTGEEVRVSASGASAVFRAGSQMLVVARSRPEPPAITVGRGFAPAQIAATLTVPVSALHESAVMAAAGPSGIVSVNAGENGITMGGVDGIARVPLVGALTSGRELPLCVRLQALSLVALGGIALAGTVEVQVVRGSGRAAIHCEVGGRFLIAMCA